VVRSATHCHKIVSELQVGGSIFEYRLTNFTGYELDGLGIESQWWARFFAPVQTGPGVHPASYTMGTVSFPGGKDWPGREADPSPPSSAVGHERVELYLYSPNGPYGLYKGDLYLYKVSQFLMILCDKDIHNTLLIVRTWWVMCVCGTN